MGNRLMLQFRREQISLLLSPEMSNGIEILRIVMNRQPSQVECSPYHHSPVGDDGFEIESSVSLIRQMLIFPRNWKCVDVRRTYARVGRLSKSRTCTVSHFSAFPFKANLSRFLAPHSILKTSFSLIQFDIYDFVQIKPSGCNIR